MSACTFFGHRDCPESILPKLRNTLVELITHHGVDLFYVGNHGQFDRFVRAQLRLLEKEYPHIRYAVVLAYLPREGSCLEEDASDTMLPEGIESVHPKYAIVWRNNWMLRNADYVVAYVTHTWGHSAGFVQKARAQKRIVIDL